MRREPLSAIGGRKFVLSVFGITAIAVCAIKGADALSFGSIALIVGAFVGGNSYTTGKALAKEPTGG